MNNIKQEGRVQSTVRKRLFFLLFMVLTISALARLSVLFLRQNDELKTIKKDKEIKQELIKEKHKDRTRLKLLKKKYKDMVGWIEIKGTDHYSLLDLRLQDEITKEQYFEKKSQLEDKLYDLQKELDENISKQIKSIDSFGNKLEVLKNIIGEEYVFDADNVPLDIVEEFVDEIVVYKDKFIWKLGICRDGITCRVEGRVNNPKLSIEEIPPVCRQQHRLQSPTRGNNNQNNEYAYLTTLVLGQKHATKFIRTHPLYKQAKLKGKDLVVEIYI